MDWKTEFERLKEQYIQREQAQVDHTYRHLRRLSQSRKYQAKHRASLPPGQDAKRQMEYLTRRPFVLLRSKLKRVSCNEELSIFEAYVQWDALPKHKRQIGHNLTPDKILLLKEECLTV